MAFFDNQLLLSNAQSISSSSVASTNIYDVATQATATGTAATNITFGAGNPVGIDIGTGDGMAALHAFFLITTTGTGSGTVSFAVQAAPTSTLTGNSAGTYVTLAQSQAFVGTALTAGDVIDLPIPPYASAADQIGPGMSYLPRFYRLYYTCANTVTVSVTGYIGVSPPLGYVSTQIGNNLTSV